MTLEECYRTLGLQAGASAARIKQAYRILAKTWHPDRYASIPALRQQCEARMRKINEAYRVLRDLARRPGAAPPPPRPQARPQRPAPPPPPPPPPPYARPRPETEPETEPPEAPTPSLRPDEWLQPWRWRKQPKPKAKASPFFRWRRAGEEPDYAGLYQAGAFFGLAVAAFAAYYLHWDRRAEPTYQQALRVTMSVSCVYGAYFALRRAYWEYTLLLAMLAAVFNPLLPVEMKPLEWRSFTVLCPVILVYLWLAMRKREESRG